MILRLTNHFDSYKARILHIPLPWEWSSEPERPISSLIIRRRPLRGSRDYLFV